MSDYIYDVLNKFHEKAMTAMISNDKDSYCYYNNCLVHAQRCAGYFDSILVRNQDKIPCFNTQNKIELLKDKIRQWENKCNDQRIEINRLKKELREAKKEVQANEE